MKTALNHQSRIFILFFFPLLFAAIGARAQWSTDGAVNTPVAVKEGYQSASRIVTDKKGGAIVTWWSYDTDVSNYNIYAQRISRTGQLLWTEGGVPVSASIASTHIPYMTADGEGGAIIAWFEPRNENKNENFAQKVNAEGQLMWTVDGVSMGTTEDFFQQGSPSITSDSAGGAILAWDDWRGGFEDPHFSVRAQHIGAGGSIQWEAGGIALCNTSTTSGHGDPIITSDGNGGAIVTWDHISGDVSTGNRNIFAQKVNADGSIAWGSDGLSVCTYEKEQRNPQIVADGIGGAFIAWEDYRNPNSVSQLYIQKVNASGQAIWDTDGIPVAESTTSSQLGHKLVSDGEGGVFIGWDFSSGVSVIQHLNAAGERIWSDNGVSPSGLRESRYIDLILDGEGGVITVWTGTSGDIMAQRVNATGESLWDERGAYICYAQGNQWEPKLTADDTGGAIAVWDDYRNVDVNASDIYVQRFSKNGILEQPQDPVEPEGLAEYEAYRSSLMQNFPNPFKVSTEISYQVEKRGFVSLTVIDLTGKEVAALVSEEKSPGRYSVCFEAKSLPAGIYLYRLCASGISETKRMIIGL
ncbi:MAG: T9SS type A sorting domain-containing protein [Bacteroidota bacterium]